jgi:hypothetical protein
MGDILWPGTLRNALAGVLDDHHDVLLLLDLPLDPPADAAARPGLGPTLASHDRSSAFYQIREHIRCLSF